MDSSLTLLISLWGRRDNVRTWNDELPHTRGTSQSFNTLWKQSESDSLHFVEIWYFTSAKWWKNSTDESRRLVDPFKVDTIPEDGPGHPFGRMVQWLSGGLEVFFSPFFFLQPKIFPKKALFFVLGVWIPKLSCFWVGFTWPCSSWHIL